MKTELSSIKIKKKYFNQDQKYNILSQDPTDMTQGLK